MPQRRRTRRRVTWKGVALAAIVASLALTIALTRDPAPALGEIQPDHIVHEFGNVRMRDGLVAATFPLSIDGVVDAVDLTTS
jgi:hypothetical protein